MKKVYTGIGITMFVVGVVIMMFLSSYISTASISCNVPIGAFVEIGLIVGGIIVALYGLVRNEEVKT